MFKLLLYLFVVTVLIGIIIVFRSKFMNICILPPCEKEKKCDVSPVKVSEETLTVGVIDKYSSLCLEKSKDCKQDVFCYIIALDDTVNPSNLRPSCIDENRCEITCNKDVNMVYVTYKWMKDVVQIGC